MDIKVKALVWAEMVSAGIVPMDTESLAREQHKISQCFDGLSAEDQRVLKRKFRKLWRRQRGKRFFGRRHLREGEPSASMMRRRKTAVLRKFMVDALNLIRKNDPTYGEVLY